MPFRTYRHGDWRQSFPTEAQAIQILGQFHGGIIECFDD
jgi:hypothetical protein